jgi:DNA-binding transcriptional regulator YiaG
VFIKVLLENAVSAIVNPADFTLIVAPLTFLVVILVGIVLFMARKKDHADVQVKNLEKQLRSGSIDKKAFKGKVKSLRKVKALDAEMQKLKQLRQDRKLDNDTYSRLWHILIRLRMQEQGYANMAMNSYVKKMGLEKEQQCAEA